MIQKTAETVLKDYSKTKVLSLLGLKRSTFYKRLHPVPSARRLENKRLTAKIAEHYHATKGRYGAPKIYQLLLQEGERCSLKRVQKLMKQQGLRAMTVKKWRPEPVEAETKDEPMLYHNLLKQNFTTTGLNQKWSTDITYIHTEKDGWCYLSSIMDLHSRRIIAWKFSKRMTTALVLETLKKVEHRANESLILQTDRGSQYTSHAYEKALSRLQISHSYSKKGYPYDNSCIESFHASLKKEEVYQHPDYPDFETARLALFEYIEGFYNRTRIHSALDYKTPEAVEAQAA